MADIDIGQISEALNNKTDRNMRNVDTAAKADSVIDYQVPTAENGYTWYRKYASGWVEQGGDIPLNTTSVIFPVEMADSNYICSIIFRSTTNSTNVTFKTAYTQTQTTTGFTCDSSESTYKSWQVCGMAA